MVPGRGCVTAFRRQQSSPGAAGVGNGQTVMVVRVLAPVGVIVLCVGWYLFGWATEIGSGERFWVRPPVPFWFLGLVVALMLLTGWSWYRWRVARRHCVGHCRRCGYNLTGNRSGRCPECGQAVRVTDGLKRGVRSR